MTARPMPYLVTIDGKLHRVEPGSPVLWGLPTVRIVPLPSPPPSVGREVNANRGNPQGGNE